MPFESRLRRLIAFVIVAAVLTLAVFIQSYRSALDPARLQQQAERVASRLTGHEVSVGHAEVTFDDGPAVDLIDIGWPDRSARTAGLYIGRVRVHFDPISVLRGDPSVSRIRIDRPVLDLTRTADGKFEFGLEPSEGHEAEKPLNEAVFERLRNIRKIRVTGGRLAFNDLAQPPTSRELRLDGVEFSIRRGVLSDSYAFSLDTKVTRLGRSGRVSANGKLGSPFRSGGPPKIEDLRVHLSGDRVPEVWFGRVLEAIWPGARPSRAMDLSLDLRYRQGEGAHAKGSVVFMPPPGLHAPRGAPTAVDRIRYDIRAVGDSIILDHVDLVWDGVPIKVHGIIEHKAKFPSVFKGYFRIPQYSFRGQFARILRMTLPKEFVQVVESRTTSAEFSDFQINFAGQFGGIGSKNIFDSAGATVSVHGKIRDGDFKLLANSPRLQKLQSTLHYSRRILRLEFSNGLFKDDPLPPLSLTIDRRHPTRRMTFRIHGLVTDAFIEEIRGGRRVRDRLLVRDRPGLFGLVALTDLRLQRSGKGPHLTLRHLDMRFNDDAIVVDGGAGTYRGIPFEISGSIRKGNPPTVDLSATFEGKSVGRVFGILFPGAQAEGNGAPDGEIVDDGLPLSEMEGRLEILRGRYRNVSLGDLEANIQFREGLLRLDDLRISNDGGQITGAGWYNLREGREGTEPGFFFETEVRGMDAQALFRNLNLDNDRLEGSVWLHGTIRENRAGPGPFAARCEGEFDFEVTDGTLHEMTALRKVLDRLDISIRSAAARRDDIPFRRMSGKLRLSGGKLSSEKIVIHAVERRIQIEGEIDLVEPGKPTKLIVGVELFKTVDNIFNSMPIGSLLTGKDNNIAMVHFRIEGPWNELKSELILIKSLQGRLGPKHRPRPVRPPRPPRVGRLRKAGGDA